VITIHQRHRQMDRRTDRQTTCDRNTALCTKVHRAVKMTKSTQIKYNPDMQTTQKTAKTKLPWFGRFSQDSAMKRSGLIIQCSQAHLGQE